MKRCLTAAALAAFLLAGLPTVAKAHHDREAFRVNGKACSYRWWEGTSEHQRWAVKQIIRCQVHRMEQKFEAGVIPGSAPKALAVADCESDFLWWVLSNGNGGVYQQRVKFWDWRSAVYGFPDASWKNARANVIVSLRMVRHEGWGPWSCA